MSRVNKRRGLVDQETRCQYCSISSFFYFYFRCQKVPLIDCPNDIGWSNFKMLALVARRRRRCNKRVKVPTNGSHQNCEELVVHSLLSSTKLVRYKIVHFLFFPTLFFRRLSLPLRSLSFLISRTSV